jgi:citrate/tricarballylate utilization protein
MNMSLAELVAAAEAEAARELTICNACRYCEGFCAVFPAMTRRLEFGRNDVHYLANLCHNCGACLHACQYAPPHEFGVNLPRALAELRVNTYTEYAWPRAFGGLYRKAGAYVALSLGAGLALFLLLALIAGGGLVRPPNGGNFYAVFPHNLLVTLFGLVFGWVVLALGIGMMRFWNAWRPGPGSSGAAVEAAGNALTLKYLDGGHGEGCNEADDRFTLARRVAHHFTFYGFMLCFASTGTATLYHYALGWQAPYAFASLPVVLGTLGGVGLLIGPLGLFLLNIKRHPDHGDQSQKAMDHGLIWLLLFVSLTGLVLLVLRDTAAMTVLLAVHLGFVMALFLTMPYGKFAHGIYRGAALLKYSIEKRQPNRLRLGAD